MSPQRKNWYAEIAVAILVIVLIILSVLLVQQYQHIQRLSYIATHRQSLLRSLNGSGPLSAADASSTQTWMTFDYINRAFALPEQYLQASLNISDSRYPRLTITEYAQDAKASPIATLMSVQEAIGSYYSVSSAQPASSTPSASSTPNQ